MYLLWWLFLALLQPMLTSQVPGADSVREACAPGLTLEPLVMSCWSESDRKGMISAFVFRWGSAWSSAKAITDTMHVVVGPKVTIYLDAGYTATVGVQCPPPPSVTTQKRALLPTAVGVTVGVGRPCVHALWVPSPPPRPGVPVKAHEQPYLAEVVALLVPKANPGRMYCLAQFHEVRLGP